MTPQEAIIILVNATAGLAATRAQHNQINQAINTLQTFIASGAQITNELPIEKAAQKMAIEAKKKITKPEVNA